MVALRPIEELILNWIGTEALVRSSTQMLILQLRRVTSCINRMSPLRECLVRGSDSRKCLAYAHLHRSSVGAEAHRMMVFSDFFSAAVERARLK